MRVFFGKKGQDKVPVVILHSTSKKKLRTKPHPSSQVDLFFFPRFSFSND